MPASTATPAPAFPRIPGPVTLPAPAWRPLGPELEEPTCLVLFESLDAVEPRGAARKG